MNTIESLIAFVKSAKLPDDVKEVLTDRLMAEGLTTDVVDALKEAFQDELDLAFKEAGVELDPKDPEVAEFMAKYQKDVDAVQTEGAAELQSIKKDINHGIAEVQTTADAARADQIRKDFP